MKAFMIYIIFISIILLSENVFSIKLNTNTINEISIKSDSALENSILKDKSTIKAQAETKTEIKKTNLLKSKNSIRSQLEAKKLLTEEEVKHF